jgi:hypothetical protein
VLLGPLLGARLKHVLHTERRSVAGGLPTQLISVRVHAMFGLITGGRRRSSLLTKMNTAGFRLEHMIVRQAATGMKRRGTCFLM